MTRSPPPSGPLPGALLLFGALLGAAACTGSPPARYFLIAPGPRPAGEAPSPATAERTVLVGPVEIPRYLDRPEMMVRTGANEIHPMPDALWAEPLKDLLPRVLSRELERLLPGVRVERFPRAGPRPPAVSVRLRVDRFEGDRAGKGVLEGRWILASGGGPPASRTFRYEAAVRDPEDPAAVTAALNSAVESLVRDLADAVRAALLRSDRPPSEIPPRK